MEENKPAPANKGYQKIKKEPEAKEPPKPKGSVDYSSPNAKKWPAMNAAIESGNVEVVRQFIEEGLNVNLSQDGVTPLMRAAVKGRTEVAELILNAGVNINEKSDDGETALHMAASGQAGMAIVELLIQSGIDLEAKNKAGKTALALAEETKHRDVAKVIKKHQLQRSADAKEWEDFLNSPEGKPFKQQKFLDTLSTVPRLWWLPVIAFGGVGFAVGFLFGSKQLWPVVIGMLVGGLVDLAFYLVERNTIQYLDKIGPLPFLDIATLRQKRKNGEPIFASQQDNGPADAPAGPADLPSSDAGPSLEEQLPDLSNIDETTTFEKPTNKLDLSWAIYIGVATIIALLIIAGYLNREPAIKWYYAKKIERTGLAFTDQSFLEAASGNKEEAIDLFIRAGVNLNTVNDKGRTALMLASEKGHAALVRKLFLLNTESANRTDKSGSTALMIAARAGQEKAVQALMESGANVNYTAPSAEGAATALQAALDVPEYKEANARIVSLLLQKGADPKVRNKSGRAALFIAAERGLTDAAGMMLEKGADVNETDAAGGFPLLAAACRGQAGIVTLFADKGANLQAAGMDGLTPLMCAVREGHGDTVKALLEKGAPVNAKNKNGDTALTDATRAGNADAVRLLLAKGADPDAGTVPETFSAFAGKPLVLNLKKAAIADVLKRLAQTAAEDGYTVTIESKRSDKLNAALNAPWNKVLLELAKKNRLVLVVKDKNVLVLP